ncbi:MAG: hypothetical protein Q9160_008452 [Pyrenula sp. 1 TL-2023]
MLQLRWLAIVCLVFCFALSVALLVLSVRQVVYVGSDLAETGVADIIVNEVKKARYGYLPQCLHSWGNIVALASGIGGVNDALLLIFMLWKLEYKRPRVNRLVSFLRPFIAAFAIVRSLVAVIWVWQAWNQYGSTKIDINTPASPKDGRYPASVGCFTLEGWNRQLAKLDYYTDDTQTWRSLARQARAIRALTIPLLVFYVVVFVCVLVVERKRKRARSSLTASPTGYPTGSPTGPPMEIELKN